MAWKMIADEGVRQGKMFDDIMEDIRQELNFNSPKSKEVYDYLIENYDRDKLFSNKFTIKKLLPDPFKDLENTQQILSLLQKAQTAIEDLETLYREMQSGNIEGNLAERKFEIIEQGIERGYHAIFNILEAIQENFKFS
tara:strand:+ start:21461 stop:21877 length:417 start_codon:yes stop_codon:yes gene_type:complete